MAAIIPEALVVAGPEDVQRYATSASGINESGNVVWVGTSWNTAIPHCERDFSKPVTRYREPLASPRPLGPLIYSYHLCAFSAAYSRMASRFRSFSTCDPCGRANTAPHGALQLNLKSAQGISLSVGKYRLCHPRHTYPESERLRLRTRGVETEFPGSKSCWTMSL